MSNESPLTSEPVDFVLRIFHQLSKPENATNLKSFLPKSGPVSPKQLPEVLDHLVSNGQVRSYRQSRTSCYWLPELEEQAERRIIEALEDLPLTPTELKGRYKSLLVGWPEAKRNEFQAHLLEEKRIHKVRALDGRAILLSVRPQLNVRDYVKLALKLAVSKLAKKGVSEEQVWETVASLISSPGEMTETPPPVNFEELILDRMQKIDSAAATGALVSLTDLRHSLKSEIPGKSQYDQAVLHLARQGRVALHRHDYASSLSEQERNDLVADDQGNHYIGIALRL